MNNYSFINRTRQTKNGGGVGMYISKHLEFKIREDLTVFDEEIYESLFIKVQFQEAKNKIIGIIYRPPNNKYNKFEEHLTNILEYLNIWIRRTKDMYIIGDFNLDMLKMNFDPRT